MIANYNPANHLQLRAANCPTACLSAPVTTILFPSSATVQTDEKGQWLSPPLPESDHVFLRLNHPDYATDPNFVDTLAPLDELRSGIATIVLKK